MSNYKFIKLNKNSKIPISGQRLTQNDAHDLKDININFYNIGLLAGVNNLLILDIDDKNGGLLEWKQYLNENFNPYTMQQQTPGGGYHYIFKHYDDTYTEEENEAIRRLKNKAGYRNKGLDIRKGAGSYVVFNGSSIDSRHYKLINDLTPAKIPLKLVLWLLEFETETKTAINNNIVLMDDTEQLKEYLKYFNMVSSRQWFKITTAIKNLLNYNDDLDADKIIKIWNKWSKQQPGYNKSNNVKIWASIKADISFNYIISQYNKKQPKDKQLKYLESFKPLDELTPPNDINKLIINNTFLYNNEYTGEQFNEEIFLNYDTIIIKSTTGTGKTTATARHVETYFKTNPHLKFLSIVNLKTLASQHAESFKCINIVSYEADKINKDDDNIVVCLNSLMMFSKYEPSFFNNYVVYIDEIMSLINSLTHNNLLDRNLKGVYIVLMRIIRNCNKIIVSDATINNNTFNLLKNRPNDKKLFIDNQYKKYKGITVFKFNNENDFLKETKEHVKNNNFFLFGCDSLELTKHYFNEVITDENKYKASLYNSEQKFNIKNASKEFKDKFVFYSPSITTGLDFTIDTPQDVFIYINGRSIDPAGSFQQLSRTRNIKNVYLYIADIESKPAKYNTLDGAMSHLKNISKYEKETTLNKMCGSFDDNDEYKFNENSFFTLYSFNEYLNDIYNTNKKQHFYLKLYENGFKIIEKGNTETLNKETKNKMKARKNELNEKLFNDEIIKMNKPDTPKETNDKKNELIDKIFKMNEPDTPNETKYKMKANKNELNEEIIKMNDAKNESNIKKAMNYLNINNVETALKYQEILQDKFKREDYFNLIKLLRPQKHILNKLKKTRDNITGYKVIYNTFYKVSLLWELEKELNIISRFTFNKLEIDKPFKIPDDLHNKINTAYRCKTYPTTYNGFIEYYYYKIKHLTGQTDILKNERKRTNGNKRTYFYSIDEKQLNDVLKLYELTDPKREYLFNSPYFYELPKQDTEQPEQKININFIDDLEAGFYDPEGLDFGL